MSGTKVHISQDTVAFKLQDCPDPKGKCPAWWVRKEALVCWTLGLLVPLDS